jgi:ribosomal protein L10
MDYENLTLKQLQKMREDIRIKQAELDELDNKLIKAQSKVYGYIHEKKVQEFLTR